MPNFLRLAVVENWITSIAGLLAAIGVYLLNHRDPKCIGCALGLFLVGLAAKDPSILKKVAETYGGTGSKI